MDLPFRIRPRFFDSYVFDNEGVLCVKEFVQEVDFQVDTIRTSTNTTVQERRQTAWQGDEHVAPFAYSGKSMVRNSWSPLVLQIRNELYKETSHYYDGCLLNLYPDGYSGMRYHVDPDQGTLWGYETVVVSVGATRRFAFRLIESDGDDDVTKDSLSRPHIFVLMNGDVTEMFDDCQERFQHTVKPADKKQEKAPRVSLVFKKTIDSTLHHDDNTKII